jgi:hypothetical protein
MSRREPTRGVGLVVVAVLAGIAGCREEVTPPDPDGGPRIDPVPVEAIDRACVLVASCAEAGADTASDCATAALRRPASGQRYAPAWLDCVEAAGPDCDAQAACSPAPPAERCGELGQGSFCDGDVVVSCFSGLVEFTTDCAEWRLACSEEGDAASCQGDGRSCLPGTEGCDGDDAILCLGYREATVACDGLVEGRTCAMSGDRAECAPPGDGCDPLTTPGACEGSELVLCSAGGGSTRVDCAALGFETCTLDATGRAICGAAD